MASSSIVKEDKYRTYLQGDEERNTKWRFGAPPNYDVVNKLFEDGKTKVVCVCVCVFFVINNVGLGVCGVVLICIRSSLISIIKKTVILISYICFFMSAGMASGVT